MKWVKIQLIPEPEPEQEPKSEPEPKAEEESTEPKETEEVAAEEPSNKEESKPASPEKDSAEESSPKKESSQESSSKEAESSPKDTSKDTSEKDEERPKRQRDSSKRVNIVLLLTVFGVEFFLNIFTSRTDSDFKMVSSLFLNMNSIFSSATQLFRLILIKSQTWMSDGLYCSHFWH